MVNVSDLLDIGPVVSSGTDRLTNVDNETTVFGDPDACHSVKGESYQIGESFYDGCRAFCTCLAPSSAEEESEEQSTTRPPVAKLLCNPIRCPTTFGLDVLNPLCLKWDEHPDFVAQPPLCCPPVPVCISDGTCEYEGMR